jgi:hypothetical protein
MSEHYFVVELCCFGLLLEVAIKIFEFLLLSMCLVFQNLGIFFCLNLVSERFVSSLLSVVPVVIVIISKRFIFVSES